MAYLHCHSCYWQQDDFWSETYNPIQSLQDWAKNLLDPKFNESFTDDAGFIKEHGDLTLREVIEQECEKAARTIKKMIYRTEKEYKELNPNGKCPQCGAYLDVD